MREYKFRAWNKLNSCWVYSNIIGLDLFFLSAARKDFSTIGEYTGLHDKNDKEIYEKDKVIISEVAERSYEATVVFKDGAFRCSYYGRPLINKSHRIEVTGNEYEGAAQ